MSKTIEYKTWNAMKDRCYNSNNASYKNYGGRGIIVCDRWKNSFSAFLEDMGLKPFPKAQIDRIDNNDNYGLSNCRWTTAKINRRNSRFTKLTMEIAERIRNDYATGIYFQKELGNIYNVGQDTISLIITKKIWI